MERVLCASRVPQDLRRLPVVERDAGGESDPVLDCRNQVALPFGAPHRGQVASRDPATVTRAAVASCGVDLTSTEPGTSHLDQRGAFLRTKEAVVKTYARPPRELCAPEEHAVCVSRARRVLGEPREWVQSCGRTSLTTFQLDYNESSKEERPHPTSARDRRFCEAECCGGRSCDVTSALCRIRLFITSEDSFQNKSVSRWCSSLFSSDRTCARRRPHHVSRVVHSARRGATRCVARAHVLSVRLVLYVPHDVAALDAVLGGLVQLEQHEE
eukprot:scaffold40578_cov69-Phaeocystis_antarctica.AAC.2